MPSAVRLGDTCTLNRNIRCIEISSERILPQKLIALNRNIRCIEIYDELVKMKNQPG